MRRINSIFTANMRRIYIYQHLEWPHFTWDNDSLITLLVSVRHKQGRLKGYMEALGFALRNEATLQTLTQDVLKSSEIEGEMLNLAQVRSSIARKLGMNIAGLVPADRHVEGVVEMMLDATRNAHKKLDAERLFGWHSALFPSGRSGLHKLVVGNWRDNKNGPMRVISGAIGKEKVHFEAPDSSQLKKEMRLFFSWFNTEKKLDPVIKSAVAHLWFLTVHPFSDGNGRIARAIADMQLARADGDEQRFYSMSAQIRLDRNAYYNMLEVTQKGKLDITAWLVWYLNCLDRALITTDESLKKIMSKTRFWDKHQKTEINERQRFMINKLFEGFTGNLTSAKWAKMTKCSTDTALRDVNALIKKKILKKEEGGGRSTSYSLKS